MNTKTAVAAGVLATLITVGGGGSPGGSSGQLQYNNAGAFDGVTGTTVTSGRLAEIVFGTADQLCLRDATNTFGSSCELVASTGGKSEFSSLGFRTGSGVWVIQHDNGSSRQIFGYSTGGIAQWFFTDSGVSLSLNRSSGSGGRFFIDSRSVGAFVFDASESGTFLHRSVETVTTTKTTQLIESNEIYTNTGDTDGSTYTLTNDPPTVGANWCWAVNAGQTITIQASAGETLYYGGATCGTSLTSNTPGHTVCIAVIVAGSGGKFMAIGGVGTWTCT